MGCVYRDVAARNILVNALNICKVQFFPYSRNSSDTNAILSVIIVSVR